MECADILEIWQYEVQMTDSKYFIVVSLLFYIYILCIKCIFNKWWRYVYTNINYFILLLKDINGLNNFSHLFVYV